MVRRAWTALAVIAALASGLAAGCAGGPGPAAGPGGSAGAGSTPGSTAAPALLAAVRAAAGDAGVPLTDQQGTCMEAFLADHPGLGAKTRPESVEDSRAAYEMLVRCLGRAGTADFLAGSTGGDEALRACQRQIFDSLGDAGLVDELVAAEGQPPGTLLERVSACGFPAGGPPSGGAASGDAPPSSSGPG